MCSNAGECSLNLSGLVQPWPHTISVFLFSLAEALGPRSVAVILSGMDHDGSAALKAVKTAGGVTFAQADAAYPSMPRHAVETGHVDYVLTSTDIGSALLRLAQEPLEVLS